MPRTKKNSNKPIDKEDDDKTNMVNLILHLPIRSSEVIKDSEIFQNDELFSNTNNLLFVKKNEKKIEDNETLISFNMPNTNKDNLEPAHCNITTNYSYINKNNWPRKTHVRCWWCTHTFTTTPCSIPFKYEDETFKVYGCFCSFNCALAYIINNIEDRKWEKTELLHLLYKEIHGKYERIKPAFKKEVLIDYGGKLNISEFRKYSANQEITYDISIPPIISIQPRIDHRNLNSSIQRTKKRSILEELEKNDRERNKMKVKRMEPINNNKSFVNLFKKK